MLNVNCSPDHLDYRYDEDRLVAECGACGQQWPIPADATNSAIAAEVIDELRERFAGILPESLEAGDVDLSIYAPALTQLRLDPWVEVSHGVESEVDARLRRGGATPSK